MPEDWREVEGYADACATLASPTVASGLTFECRLRHRNDVGLVLDVWTGGYPVCNINLLTDTWRRPKWDRSGYLTWQQCQISYALRKRVLPGTVATHDPHVQRGDHDDELQLAELSSANLRARLVDIIERAKHGTGFVGRSHALLARLFMKYCKAEGGDNINRIVFYRYMGMPLGVVWVEHTDGTADLPLWLCRARHMPLQRMLGQHPYFSVPRDWILALEHPPLQQCWPGIRNGAG